MSARRVLTLALVLLTSSAAPAFADPGWQGAGVYTTQFDPPTDLRFFTDAQGGSLLGAKLRDPATGYDSLRAWRGIANGFSSLTSIMSATTPIESWDMVLQPNPDQPYAVAWSTPSPTYSVRMGVYDVSDGGWSTYIMATSTVQISSVRVFAAGNETLVVWMNYSGTNSLESRMRNSIGVLGDLTAFDLTSDEIYGFSGGSSAAGVVSVVWDQVWGGPREVVGRHYSPGYGWQTLTTATVGAPEWTNSTPLAVVDPGGNVTAFFAMQNGTTIELHSTTFRSNSTFTQPVDLVDAFVPTSYGGAILQYRDGAGVAAAWMVYEADKLPELRIATRPAGGPWQAPRIISVPSALVALRDFSLNGSGDSVVSLVEFVGGFYDHWVARIPAAGGQRPWERPPLVFTLTSESDRTKVLAGPDGNFSAAWLERRGDRNELVTRLYSPDDIPPALTVAAPVEGAVVKVPTAVVSGVTEPNATLTVGSLIVAVAADGSFAVPYALQNGTNRIDVRARDAFGNEVTASVNVTYDDPVRALGLALNASNANLTAARADLAAAQAALTLLEGDQNTTEVDLAAARGNLSAANNRVADLESHVSTLSAQLANANGRIDALEGGDSPVPKADNTLALLALILAGVAAALAGFGLMRGRNGKKAPAPWLEPLPPGPPKP